MFTRRRLLLFCALIGFVAITGRTIRAEDPIVVFHGIGDLPPRAGGGPDPVASIVRDATVHNGVIYAVGASADLPSSGGNTNRPALWTWDGTSATLSALPEVLLSDNLGVAAAAAITPDAAYIAGQSHSFLNLPYFDAVRWTTSLVPNAASLMNLNAAPFPRYTFVSSSINQPIGNDTGATAISADGSIIFGTARQGTASPVIRRAVRFDVNANTSTIIPLLDPITHDRNFPAARGASADGSVVVGVSGGAAFETGKAFRYVNGAVSGIPFLPGGNGNRALAVSPDGNLTLVTGSSASLPNGEVYIHNASTNEVTRLGAANGSLSLPWGPGVSGGMSADGSVVAINFVGACFQPQCIPDRTAYVRNSHGWFHLAAVLAAGGAPLPDEWSSLEISGMSSDGTLIFGQGRHNDNLEGFVAEFKDPDLLRDFNPQPAPPASMALVGAWQFCSEDEPNCANADDANAVVVFAADGNYYHIEDSGYERGIYTLDGSTLTITTLLDTNGSTGISDDNGRILDDGTVVGDTLKVGGQVVGHRLTGSAGSVIGAWFGAFPEENAIAVLVQSQAKYWFAVEAPGDVMFDYGTYVRDPNTGQLTSDSIAPVDGPPDPGNVVTLSPDELQLTVDDDDDEPFTVTRVIDPRTPAITSALAATATTALQFAYQITATNTPTTFDAVGLPAGLGINAAGLIAGTPSVTGTFDVLIEASNALSTVTGRNHLSLSVIAPVAVTVGQTVVTPIEPEEGEPAPLTIAFTEITGSGSISVATVDPEAASQPDPPAGFSLGDNPVYYEITPSEDLTFNGPVTICFNYAGINFTGFPRLLHYDEDLSSWVDITTSVDEVTQTICGLTSSFSPFVIAESQKNAVGFHQPIEPVAGALNTVKGGSTVPLKFNVYGDNGSEITDPAGMTFDLARIACETGALEDAAPFQTTGSTTLRYDVTARQFIQNWKTPKTPGACYLVKVTGDGLLLSARFKVK